MGIAQRGKKRAYLGQPKADWGQTSPSLALSWAKQEPTWAQLGRNLRRTRAQTWAQLGYNMAQLGHVWTWSCVGASGAEVGPKARPMWATWPRTNPSKPKNVGNSGKKGSFQNFAQLGPKLAPSGHVGLKLGPKRSRWTQIEAMWCTWKFKSILACRNLAPLARASHQVGPNGDTTWGTLLQRKRHR